MANTPDPRDFITEDTIFVTPMGSRLYGTDNAQSDYDFLILTTGENGKRINSSKVTEELDMRRVDYNTLITALNTKPGNHYLESIYSNKKILGPRAADYMPTLEAFIPAADLLRNMLFKTAIGTLHEDKYKRIRFAMYLASRWNQWYWSGQQKFNPTLNSAELQAITELADMLFPLDYDARKEYFKSNLFFQDKAMAESTYKLDLNPRGL